MLTLVLSLTAAASTCIQDCSDAHYTCLVHADADTNNNCVLIGSERLRALWDECYSGTLKDGIKACQKTTSSCIDVCMDEGEIPTFGYGMTEEGYSCPDGTVPGPMGTCQPYFGSEPEDIDPDDGCPAGFSPGPTGDCEPDDSIIPADVTSPSGDGWFITCPPGSIPGPAGGCVIGTDNTGSDDDDECPPGMLPAPDDGCVPDRGTTIGRSVVQLTVEGLEWLGLEDAAEILAASGVFPSSDPAADVEDLTATLEDAELTAWE